MVLLVLRRRDRVGKLPVKVHLIGLAQYHLFLVGLLDERIINFLESFLFFALNQYFSSALHVHILGVYANQAEEAGNKEARLNIKRPLPADVGLEAGTQAVARDDAERRRDQQVRQPCLFLTFAAVDVGPHRLINTEEDLEHACQHTTDHEHWEHCRQREHDQADDVERDAHDEHVLGITRA